MECNVEIKTASAIRTINAMLILPFWQTSSINNTLILSLLLFVVLRKFG